MRWRALRCKKGSRGKYWNLWMEIRVFRTKALSRSKTCFPFFTIHSDEGLWFETSIPTHISFGTKQQFLHLVAFTRRTNNVAHVAINFYITVVTSWLYFRNNLSIDSWKDLYKDRFPYFEFSVASNPHQTSNSNLECIPRRSPLLCLYSTEMGLSTVTSMTAIMIRTMVLLEIFTTSDVSLTYFAKSVAAFTAFPLPGLLACK